LWEPPSLFLFVSNADVHFVEFSFPKPDILANWDFWGFVASSVKPERQICLRLRRALASLVFNLRRKSLATLSGHDCLGHWVRNGFSSSGLHKRTRSSAD
jgi:hypothetical protein